MFESLGECVCIRICEGLEQLTPNYAYENLYGSVSKFRFTARRTRTTRDGKMPVCNVSSPHVFT